MKNLVCALILAFTILLIPGCKKNNDATCLTPSYQATIADKVIQVDVQGGDIENGYEIEYGPTGFTQGSGTTASFVANNYSFTVSAYGGYDIFIRKKCSNGGTSGWSSRNNVTVDGSTSTCQQPNSLNFYTSSNYEFTWYGFNNFYDIEYGPTGFTIGNGTRLRTNNQYTYDAIMHAGITYDFYVRGNCGGNAFSKWSGPQSVYAQTDQNIAVACTDPTDLYAYQVNAQEINYSCVGHGSVSYEIAFSTSGTTNNGNILATGSPNGTVGNPGGFSGTHYFWVRGKCVSGSFTNWVVSQVQ